MPECYSSLQLKLTQFARGIHVSFYGSLEFLYYTVQFGLMFCLDGLLQDPRTRPASCGIVPHAVRPPRIVPCHSLHHTSLRIASGKRLSAAGQCYIFLFVSLAVRRIHR